MKFSKLIVAIVFFTFLCPPLNGQCQDNQKRNFPVPDTASKNIQHLIALPPPDWAFTNPTDASGWKDLVAHVQATAGAPIPALLAKMNVEMKTGNINGVNVYELTPAAGIKDKDKVLLHFHGGGYVMNPGEAGTPEGIMMAGLGGMKVISVDYRMLPDHPFPAALDDARAVYSQLLKTYKPENIGLIGSSAGGGLALALILAAREANLPLPGAVAPGMPWVDLSKTGDTYFTNDGVDNVLVSYDGWVKKAARAYANGRDLKDPLLSPVYGDVKGFPPAFITTGTRDLFLSNSARMHQKFLEAGVPSELLVFEGMSHFQYLMDPAAEETRLHFRLLKDFFHKNIGTSARAD